MVSRNHSLDVLKFVCAFLVVVIHTSCCVWHDAVLPITRCAVPCFFMISGYCLWSEEGINRDRLVKSMKRIIYILFWSTMVFAFAKECTSLKHGGFYIPTVNQCVDFLIYNTNPFGFHLWYLGAYLYVLIVMLFVQKFNLWRYIFLLTPILILLSVSDLFGWPYKHIRFVFVGIPYFTLGTIIKRYMPKLQAVTGGGTHTLQLYLR